MKTKYFTTTLALALLIAPLTYAFEGLYIGVDVGPNWLHKRHRDFDLGYAAAGQIGYRLCDNIRLEAEVGYRQNYMRKIHLHGSPYHTHGRMRAWSCLAQALYDFENLTYCCVTPYLGIGIGYAHQKASIHKIEEIEIKASKKNNGFAWDFIAGLTYPICDCVSMDLRYQFLRGKGSIINNALEGGIKYYF